MFRTSMTASLPMSSDPPEVVLQIYDEWRRWLELPGELPQIVWERMHQRGEYLRSLLQFMVCGSEPHRSGSDEHAEWRSHNAMQTTCMVLTAPGWHVANATLAATCLELLGGLQPGCPGFSLHICTVLQHLLIAHEADVLALLLHYQAPFVLLRALNRSGCSEVLQILLGADAMLPRIVPHIAMRPLHVTSLQQVRQYLLAFQWPKYLEAVLAGAVQTSKREPGTPGTPQVKFQSPGAAAWLESIEAGKAKATPCSTPQRQQLSTPEATPLQSLEAHRSSPSTEAAGETWMPRAPPTQTSQVMCTPPRCRPSSEGLGRDSPDLQEDSRGVAVPLDFLSSILHAFKRSDQVAERCLARMAEDWESQERAKVQVLLLKDFFIEVPLVSTLCLLTGSEFESASLLNSLLQHALQIHGSRPDVVEALAGQCLQHLDAVFSALGLHLLKMRSGREVAMGEGREALRLSGYVVQEPLGALRVEVVQIISVLSRLVPERLLPLVKPAVWNALAKWFFMYRCNHIFQAACSKLWVQVIRYGSPELQYQIFMNLRLFAGLCDAILTEGTCGDRWHNLAPETRCDSQRRVEKRQVTTCQAKHPGGLGAIVLVVRALADAVEKSQAVPALRRPLAELPQTQVLASKDIKVQEVQGFLKKMVSASNLWPQVLKALPPPATAVKIVAKAVPRGTGVFDI